MNQSKKQQRGKISKILDLVTGLMEVSPTIGVVVMLLFAVALLVLLGIIIVVVAPLLIGLIDWVMLRILYSTV